MIEMDPEDLSLCIWLQRLRGEEDAVQKQASSTNAGPAPMCPDVPRGWVSEGGAGGGVILQCGEGKPWSYGCSAARDPHAGGKALSPESSNEPPNLRSIPKARPRARH